MVIFALNKSNKALNKDEIFNYIHSKPCYLYPSRGKIEGAITRSIKDGYIEESGEKFKVKKEGKEYLKLFEPVKKEVKEKKEPKKSIAPIPGFTKYEKAIIQAILTLNERSGSSSQAIFKTIKSQHRIHVNDDKFKTQLKMALNRSQSKKYLEKVKSSYKLSKKIKEIPKSFFLQGKKKYDFGLVEKKPVSKNPSKKKTVTFESGKDSNCSLDKQVEGSSVIDTPALDTPSEESSTIISSTTESCTIEDETCLDEITEMEESQRTSLPQEVPPFVSAECTSTECTFTLPEESKESEMILVPSV